MINNLITDTIAVIIEALRNRPRLQIRVISIAILLMLLSATLWVLTNIYFFSKYSATFNTIVTGIALVGAFTLLIALASYSPIRIRNTERFYNEKIAEAESKISDEPTQVTPAWDLARVTLEAYFSRNLSQITAIFWLSVTVMIVGFAIIVWGISQAIQSPDSVIAASIAAGAGVITEFIGATFLFIYRSAIEQAINYSKTLERINSVGMAMKILDTMPDEAKPDDLKSNTKAKLVELLIQQANNGSEAG